MRSASSGKRRINPSSLELICPVPECGHTLTMLLQSQESINSGDDCLCRAAEANEGHGVFKPVEMKVGCYCYSQNCFGDKAGIG